jgi:hypothetical protein
MTKIPRVLLRSSFMLALLAVGAALAQPLPEVPSPTSPSPARNFATEIAKADLAQDGIHHPTRRQLARATHEVQAMRDSGMGWGAIANDLGLRLGEVVSSANRARHAEDTKHTKLAAAVSIDAPGPSVGHARGANGSGPGKGNGHGGGHGGGKGGGNGGGHGGGNGGGKR